MNIPHVRWAPAFANAAWSDVQPVKHAVTDYGKTLCGMEAEHGWAYRGYDDSSRPCKYCLRTLNRQQAWLDANDRRKKNARLRHLIGNKLRSEKRA